ncbi:MAG: hypothetical protein ABIO72_05485 [Patescibacteria group bacterium]
MKKLGRISLAGSFLVIVIAVFVALPIEIRRYSQHTAVSASFGAVPAEAITMPKQAPRQDSFRILFTWVEPDGYDQPNSDVVVEGAYAFSVPDLEADPSGETMITTDVPRQTFCRMKESSPGSGVWSCSADFPLSMCMSYRFLHADPKSPDGICSALNECDTYCGGHGKPFGKISLTGIDPRNSSDNWDLTDDVPNYEDPSKPCLRVGYACYSVSLGP